MTTRGEEVCQFMERYSLIPEGSKVGQPIWLLDFQRFFRDIYDNSAAISRAWYNDRFHDCSIDRSRQNGRADAALMTIYGSLSALVGGYFGFSGVAAKK